MKLKRILALALCLAMVFTTMSFNAFATESVVYDAVALQDALSAGGAVTLGSDIELSETLEISEDVVIDLGGFTLSGELDTLIKATAGYIVITNGSIENVRDNATTTLTSVYLTDNAVAQINNVAIETTGTGIYLGGSAKIIDLNATVKSYVDVNGYCAYDAISVNDNARIDVISGGTYTSNLSEKFIDTWKETHSYSATQSATIRVGSPDASIGEIRGGTFLGDMDRAFGGAVIYVNSGKIESISGGYFGFTKWGLTNPEKMVFVNTNNGGSIDEIVGGTFEKGTYKTGFGCDFEGIVAASGAFIRDTGNTVNAEVQFSTKVTTYTLNVLEVYAPVPVLEGKGTEANPYIVDSIDALKAFRDDVNAGNSYEGKYVKLTCDLDLSIARAIEEWIPVGNGVRTSKTYTGNAFKGTFDGDNHTITGVSITSSASTDDALGLFGVVDGGAVKNLNLADVNIAVAGSDLAGGAIGMMLNNATADSISVSGVVAGDDGVGGIVGRMIINGTISNCTNNASVTATTGGIGGIVGKAYYEDGSNTSEFASVENCTNNGTITSPSYIGGIVGLARANVNGCVNNGEIVGGTQTGGIVGQLVAAGKVEANENNAKISGTSHVGGIIGDYTQNGSYTYNKVTINNNTNSGELDSTGDCAAILGCNNIDGFTNIKASGNVSSYYVPGLEMFGNPEDMVIDDTNVLMKDVAKIGTTPYESLEEAFAAAVEGDTIVLLKNASPALTSQRAITKASVIDLNGKTLTLTEDDLYFGTTTFKNGSIVVDPSVRPSTAVFWMFANQTLTFEEVKLTASGVQGTYLIGLEGDNSNLNLIGSEIIVENDTALDLDIICVNSSGSNDILVEDTKVKVENLDGRVFFRGNYTICGDSDIDLSGITKSGIRIEKGQTLTIEDSARVSITGTLRDGGIHLTDPYIVYTKADTATVDATVNVTASSLKGAGTEVDPYIISCLAELKWFRDNVDTQAADGSTQYAGKYIKLTADIDLAGENWNPIGSMAGDHGSFRGIFDGGNHTISNLNVQTTGNGLGLFARTTGNAVIKNLTLDNVTVKSTDNSSYVGGLVGNSYESTKIENVHVTGDIDISGRGYIGGISGHGYVVMDNVSVVGEGTIYSTFWCAGGILGYAGEGTTNIMNAYVEGITITSAAGGLGAIVGMAEDNGGTQPISGSNLSAKDVEIKTYTGAYGDSYANYALGYLYGGNPTSKLTGNLSVEDVVIETSSGVAPSVNDAVATIRGTVYFTLQSAFDAAQDGDVIEVLRDVTINEATRQNSGATWYEGVYYVGDKSFTVDLNGFTLTNNSAVNDYLVLLKNDGANANEITFKNGKLEATSSAYCALCTSTTSTQKITINLENVELVNNNSNGAVAKIRGGAVLNVKDGTVITGNDSYVGIECVASVVNIYDGAEIYQKGLSSYVGSLAGVSNNGTLNVYGGYGESAQGGFIAMTSGGTINVYGGQWIANTDGTYANGNRSVLIAQSENGASSIVNVYGGQFAGGYNCYGAVVGDAQINISAGEFNNDPSAYVVANYAATEENGIYTVSRTALDGEGTQANPYLISNAYDLTLFRDSVNAGETKYNAEGVWVALANDIDMTGITWNKGIGYDEYYVGNFDGKNFTVKNLTITAAQYESGLSVALFANTYGDVVIKNLTIENPTLNCNYTTEVYDANVGALIGFAYNGANALIENVNVCGDIEIDAYAASGVGGLIGYTYGKFGKINNCSVIGNEGSYIKAISQVGGLVGYNFEGASEFTGCAVKNLTISSRGYMGGITGVVAQGNIIKNSEIRNVKFVLLKEENATMIGSVAGSLSGNEITLEDYTVVNVTYNGASVPVIGGHYGNPSATTVAEIDGVLYATLKDAFDAAVTGDTVTLLSDISVEGETITIPADKAITLDMNGKTITAKDTKASGSYEVFANYGELTVVGNGAIDLEAETNRGWGGYSAIFFNRGGELTIENGTFTHKGGTDMAYVVDNSANYSGDAFTNIEGGNLSSTYVAIRNYMDKHTSNGGASGIATVNVTGGNIYGYKRGIWAQIASTPAKGNITITGGTVTSVLQDSVLVDEDGASEINTVITGGTFSSDVSAFIPDNFTCPQNANGTYSVVADRSLEVYTSADEVYAEEEVTVAIKINGDNMANAFWTLEWNPDEFKPKDSNIPNSGKLTEITWQQTAGDVYANGADVASYEFIAIAQDVEVDSAFTISETYASTWVESYDGKNIVAANNNRAIVTILLNEYSFTKKFNGDVVTENKATAAFDGKANTFEVVPGIDAGLIKSITYKVDGKEVSAVSLTAEGTYFIEYAIDAVAGYADYKGTFTIVVTKAEYVVEVVEYTMGKNLVLLYTNTDDVFFKYNGNLMLDATEKEYKYDDITTDADEAVVYPHVYAFVTEDAYFTGDTNDDIFDIAKYAEKISATTDRKDLFVLGALYDADINFSNSLNVQDITTEYGVLNGHDVLYANAKYQKQILKADTDGDKKVVGSDASFVVTTVKSAMGIR